MSTVLGIMVCLLGLIVPLPPQPLDWGLSYMFLGAMGTVAVMAASPAARKEQVVVILLGLLVFFSLQVCRLSILYGNILAEVGGQTMPVGAGHAVPSFGTLWGLVSTWTVSLAVVLALTGILFPLAWRQRSSLGFILASAPLLLGVVGTVKMMLYGDMTVDEALTNCLILASGLALVTVAPAIMALALMRQTAAARPPGD